MKVGDLVRVTHGSGNGTVGVIVSLADLPLRSALLHGTPSVARLHTGEHYTLQRLEVVNEG